MEGSKRVTDTEQVMQFGSGDRKITITVLPEPEEYGLSGSVEGKMLPGLVAIRLDDTPDERRNYDVGALHVTKQSVHAAISLVPEVYAGLKSGDVLALLTVFHELGHYLHGHALRRTDNSDDKRKALIREGTVEPDELEADAFAAEYLGIDEVIAGLKKLRQYMIDRYQSEEWNPEDVALMDREIGIRIEKLEEAATGDPLNDLIPVCPNCHAMLHRTDPPLMPDDLKARLVSCD